MESKHTPAPWEIYEGDRGDCWWLDDERIISRHKGQYNEQCVCVMHGESQEGDKFLIAAAPEMLAMLRELEWSGIWAEELFQEPWDACPVCHAAASSETHKPDCRLAALIARATNDATQRPQSST